MATPSYQLKLTPLRSRAWWVTFGCGIIALSSLLAAAAQGAAINDLAIPDWADWLGSDEGYLIIAASSMATGLVWLFWLYRAVANLHALGAPAMNWSPGAAVIWCLVPLVNLIMQFFILRAVWQASNARSHAVPPLVATYAVSAVLPILVAFAPVIATGNIDEVNLSAEATANVLQAVSSALLATLTLGLTRAQAALRTAADIFA